MSNLFIIITKVYPVILYFALWTLFTLQYRYSL